jgi:hypothetical protein
MNKTLEIFLSILAIPIILLSPIFLGLLFIAVILEVIWNDFVAYMNNKYNKEVVNMDRL